MSTELKTIRVLEFSGRISEWEGWSEKFLARAKRKGYKKLLQGKEEVPKENEIGSDSAKKKLAELNEEAFEDIILSINHTSKQGKVTFSLVKNCKTSEYPEGNCKLAWDRLVAKYTPKTAPSLLKLKKKFANSKLESIDVYPNEWITKLESLQNDMDNICLSTKMSDQDFLIHILNNLPEEYDVVLDGLESRLMLDESDKNKLTIKDVQDKLNNRYERLNERDKHIEEIAMYTKTQYKGLCTKCGKYGHKGIQCPDEKQCWKCGEKGHMVKDCKKREDKKANNAIEYESDDDDYSLDELGL